MGRPLRLNHSQRNPRPVVITPELISLFLSLAAVAGLIWRAATESERVKASIKDVRDDLQYRYDIELQKISAQVEKNEYMIASIREQNAHKFQRYEAEISNLKTYLQKKFDFQPRRYRPLDDDDGPVTGPL